MLRLASAFALVLFAGSVAAQRAQTEEEELQRLQRRIEALDRQIEASRAERERFHIGGRVGSGRFGRCEITMDLTSRVPNVRVVNILSGTVEVLNGDRVSIHRFSFEEAEAGNMRHTLVAVDGPCQNTSVRIMRITFCELDGRLYDDCGTMLRASHPISVASQATR